jgi:hypothetical protein
MKINLKFNNNIIDIDDEKKISKILFKQKYPYSNISDKTINKILEINDNITLNLLLSLKSAIIKNNIIKQHHNLIKNEKEISEEFIKNNILLLSKKYNTSPITIIRIVFKYRGLNNKEIVNLFKKNELMNEFDKKQFLLALKYDMYGFVDEKEKLDESLLFEKKIEKILKSNNVIYETQENLMKQQQIDGHVFSTPDFLIKSELYINDKRVYWIDAKNFYGANTPFIIKSITKQTDKYIKLYGDGCIIFNHGFSSKLMFKNIVLINL